MKAEDLMIGDWVMVKERKGDDVKDYPIMVYSGNIGDIVAENLIVEPIPLTPEILEKNGFVCVAVGDNGPGTPPKFRNRYEKWECRTQWHTFHVFIDRITKRYSMNAHSNHIEGMQYVHELQHALRLCGIDKEIVL